MQWPEQITCHRVDPTSRIVSIEWRPPYESQWDGKPSTYAYPFRTCSYCGSIHPEDLAKFLSEGATLSGSDWKYGWPHKYYVEGIPNPIAGKTVMVGQRSGPNPEDNEDIMSEAPPTTHAKWYNIHLQDEGFDSEARQQLLTTLTEKSGVTWSWEPGKGIGYRAPYHGYQAGG